MKIERIYASGESCNFCDMGNFSNDGHIEYPYTHVTRVTSEYGPQIRLCDNCLKAFGSYYELVKKIHDDKPMEAS